MEGLLTTNINILSSTAPVMVTSHQACSGGDSRLICLDSDAARHRCGVVSILSYKWHELVRRTMSSRCRNLTTVPDRTAAVTIVRWFWRGTGQCRATVPLPATRVVLQTLAEMRRRLNRISYNVSTDTAPRTFPLVTTT